MGPRRFAWVILGFGVFFLASPAYWNSLHEVGTVWLLDWFSASGWNDGPLNYLAIGAMYVIAGILSLWVAGNEKRGFPTLSIGVGVSMLLVGAGLGFYLWSTGGWPFGIWQALYAFGTGPVIVSFLIGASADPDITHWLWGIVGLFLLPIILVLVITFFLHSGPFTLDVVLFFVVTLHIFILDLLWGYPLYRLGHELQ